MNKTQASIPILTIVAFLLGTTATNPPTPEIMKTQGTITLDNGLTCDTPHIDWGTLYPGQTATHQLLLHCNSTKTLSMNVTDYYPPQLRNYTSVTFSHEGRQITETTPVSITLEVFENVSRIYIFGFNIHITG